MRSELRTVVARNTTTVRCQMNEETYPRLVDLFKEMLLTPEQYAEIHVTITINSTRPNQ